MDHDMFILKIKYGDILRRITVRRSYDFSNALDMPFCKLENTIRSSFNIPATSELALVYTDKDNDEVTMVNDDDIYDACVFQGLNPVRVTARVAVRAQESHRSAHDGRPALTGDPPSWAVDIIRKLDQLLLAVKKQPVEPEVASVITKSTMTEHHVLQGVDASPSDGSTIEPAEDVLPAEEWTDIAQSGYDSEFLRRAMILRQRAIDELSD